LNEASERTRMKTVEQDDDIGADVAARVARARAAQRLFERSTQEEVDTVVTAAGWAIVEPGRNRLLAELAVEATGIGNVDDKIRKNHRKTFGLLRDLKGAKSVGVIAVEEATGIVEIARPVGVVCAVTPSTNPGATPANKILNALKGRNAIIVAPSPKGWSTCAKLVELIHEQLVKTGMAAELARDLVQVLPAPVTKRSTLELMRQCDLVVATGSQANVRAAYASGTPAFGVGAGNVAGIVDESADVEAAAERIVRSKTFDNATSCSSENSLVVVASARAPLLKALAARGAVLLDAAQKATLATLMWPDGKLSPAVIGQSATVIAERAGDVDGADRAAWRAIAAQQPRMLLVDESGVGHDHPYSGEKLSPVLTLFTVADFGSACALVEGIYAYEGAGHSVGLNTADGDPDERALELGLTLPVARVIVNQAHSIATGGSFDNGLPFSLSMGCGTWGRNNFSDNMNYRHYLNITRIARPIAEVVPSEREIFGAFFDAHGKG
jgi:sulfoacetaldehyde dehydrogenase